MHSITLSFPTLTELHAAIAKLLGTAEQAVVADIKAAEQAVVADVKAAVKGKPKAEKPAASPAPDAAASAPAPVASAPAASATPPVDAPAASTSPKADAVDYPTLQKAVFKLAGIAGTGRDAATSLLAQFAVKTFKDLDSSKWTEALAAVEAKIEQLSAPA
jgi:hypothetical protein